MNQHVRDRFVVPVFPIASLSIHSFGYRARARPILIPKTLAT